MEVWNSFNNILCLGLLTTQFFFAFSQEMFTIIRTPGNNGAWSDLDQFELPDSKCDVACSVWKAYPVTQDYCHCKCSYSREATFGFYSGSWTCLDNAKVRKQTGKFCKYKLQSEKTDNYPLTILDKLNVQYNYVRLPSPGCSVHQETSRYFTCDGRWAGIESQSFSINENGRQSVSGYQYRVTIGSGISAALLGRIISLSITCPQESSCLLFKLQGTIQCVENVSAIPSPTTQTTTATATAVATATAAATTSEPNATADPNKKGKNEKEESSGSSSTVVGVVVTVVILIVIVIVKAAYVYRKRKRGESIWLVDYFSSRVRKTRTTHPKKKTAEEAQEDAEYAEIPEEQRRTNEPVDQAGGVYNYAFDDPQTAYTAVQQAPYRPLAHDVTDHVTISSGGQLDAIF